MSVNAALKALFVLNIFKFLSRPFGLDQKDKVNFKIHKVQPGLQTIAMHILPNIWQSKWNEMKFVQLIEYNEKNIFFQELCRKWGKENSSRPLFIF